MRLGQQLRRKITMEAGSDSDAASGDSSADEDVESDSGVCAFGVVDVRGLPGNGVWL